jgi:hypothetical protein
MTPLKNSIEFDILQKLYNQIDETPLEKYPEAERGNIQALIEKMMDEVDEQ